MQDETIRTVFTFTPLLRHRTSDANRRITAVSLDTLAGRVFIGLASGHVEEHEILLRQAYLLDPGLPGAGPHSTTRLVAEKRVSKQAIKLLSCLPTASRIAILCEDGTAFVAAYDTWIITALQGVRTAAAMAADATPAAEAAAARRPMDLMNSSSDISSAVSKAGSKGRALSATATITSSPRPVRLAVAVRSITSAAKLLIYFIAPSVGPAASQPPAHLLAQIPLQDPVQELTWVGPGLFVQHTMSYSLLHPGGRLIQIAAHGSTHPRMASAPWPGGPVAAGSEGCTALGIAPGGAADPRAAAAAARGALLFQDSLIVLTDGNGAAVVGSDPIPVSEPPLALCSSGGLLVVVSDAEGVLVYDRACSRLVQRIFWAHDDPWVAAAKRIPVAEDAGGGGAVAVATSGVVMLLQPVAPDLQAHELLKRKRFDAALALIRSCRRAGEVWADTAQAQAGLLMLQELRCEDALAALEDVGLATFQPAQLLPLFPRKCRRWLPAVPQHTYWGLHGSLQSLDRICDDFLELQNSTSSSPQPSSSPPASLRVGAGTAEVATAAAAHQLLPLGAPSEPSGQGYQAMQHNGQHHHHSHHHHHHHRIHHHHNQRHHNHLQSQGSGSDAPRVMGDGNLSPVISISGVGGGGSGEVTALLADAKRHIISYLLRNRGRVGVVCLEGIDTLLVHLLVDVRDTATLEVFLGPRISPSYSGLEGGLSIGVSGGISTEELLTSASLLSSNGRSEGAGSNIGQARIGGGSNAPAIPSSLAAVAAAGPLACVSPRDAALVAALEGAGRYHALALLRSVRGQVPQALELWQRLALGEVAESRSTSGAVAMEAAASVPPAPSQGGDGAVVGAAAAPPPPPCDRVFGEPTTSASASDSVGSASAVAACAHDGVWTAATAAVAAAAAATLMSRPSWTPPLLCLSKLPWLLQAAPNWAVHILRSRPLPVADVMSLLQGRYDGVRWQYLHHLVYGSNAGGFSSSSSLPMPTEERSSEDPATPPPFEQVSKPPSSTALDSDVGREALASCPERIHWQMDPALHTELALELIDCIAVLHIRRSRQQPLNNEGRGRGEGEPSVQGLASCLASVHVAEAAEEAVAPAADSMPEELPPPLPPLPRSAPPVLPLPSPMVAGHPSHGYDDADGAPSARTCTPTPPVLPVGAAVARRQSLASPAQPAHLHRALAASSQSQPHLPTPQTCGQTHQHRSQGRPRAASQSQSQQSQSQSAISPPPTRSPPPPSDRGGSEGVALAVTVKSSGRFYISGGAGVSGAAAAAAAAAATAASSVGIAELPWLGTLGVLTTAAVARQLMLAMHAAKVAAARDWNPETEFEMDTAASSSASDAFAADGYQGDSLSLLRILSRRGDGVGMGRLAGLRAVLQHHLYCSKMYDASIVLQAIVNGAGGNSSSGGGGGGGSILANLLLRERVQLHSRLGDHAAALAVLALELQDVDNAICYCRAQCGQEGWLALLDLLLRPGVGHEPDYSAACRVLAAEGATLAPLQVLEALSDDMPLHLAHGTLSRMVGSVLHRKRQGQVLRALHRAQNLALRAELAQLQANRVMVTEESRCRGCQRPLATQIFYRYPSGVLLCARCVRPDLEAPR